MEMVGIVEARYAKDSPSRDDHEENTTRREQLSDLFLTMMTKVTSRDSPALATVRRSVEEVISNSGIFDQDQLIVSDLGQTLEQCAALLTMGGPPDTTRKDQQALVRESF